MRLPRVRFTLRAMMVWVVILAVLLVTARSAHRYLGRRGYLGPREGIYYGSYRYLGSDWKWHETRGSIIMVTRTFIFAD